MSVNKDRHKWKEYLTGWGAAMCSVTITYPFNKIAYRQSLWGSDLKAAARQLKIEGLSNLYRGVGPPLIIKSSKAFIMFGMFHQCRQRLLTEPFFGRHHVIASMIAAGVSGTTEAILTPLERVQIILLDGRQNNRYRNTFDALFQLRRYGLSEYYRGLTPTLLRNGPATFVFFNFKDGFKDFITPPKTTNKAGGEMVRYFMVGAILGAAISTIFYPLNVIRIQMQATPVGTKFLTIKATLAKLVHEREADPSTLLSGIEVNAFRSFLYWGCMNLFSEGLRHFFN